MNVKDSYEYHCHFDEKDYVCFTDGSPNIHKDVVTPIAQQIHDLLVGKGLTYMHCFTILEIVKFTLREERGAKAL